MVKISNIIVQFSEIKFWSSGPPQTQLGEESHKSVRGEVVSTMDGGR